MNIKKHIAAVLSCAVAITPQLSSLTADAAVSEPSIKVAIGIDPPSPDAEAPVSTGIVLPRVQLEYKGAEVVDASYEVITLDDGKKLYIDSGEKKIYTGMFQKGNKVDISGEFAYSESQDLYINCNADIALTKCETAEDDEAMKEKLAELPHVELGAFGDYILEADKDTITIDTGMKVYVSSGLQHYTDMFKKNNYISLEGEYAYDKETDMFYNVDSYIGLCDCIIGYNGYSYEDEDGNIVEPEIVTTTTNVNDITTSPTTTTTSAPQLKDLGFTQPEDKYPIHYYDFTLYKFDKEITVREIDSSYVVAEDGTKWGFNSYEHDIYELGRGDIIKVSGYFFYYPNSDVFYDYNSGYEIVSESNDYEKYAEIEIQNDFKHKIIDKRLAADFMIQYAPELENVEVIDLDIEENHVTVEGGYQFYFYKKSFPQINDLKIGSHINITGWFEYDPTFKEYMPASYHNSPEEEGNFTIVPEKETAEKLDRKPVSKLKGDANIDGGKDLADTVFIMQTLANPDKYQLSEQGTKNADVCGDSDGVTLNDALEIQRSLLYTK